MSPQVDYDALALRVAKALNPYLAIGLYPIDIMPVISRVLAEASALARPRPQRDEEKDKNKGE